MLGVLYANSPTFQLAISHEAKSDSSDLSEVRDLEDRWKYFRENLRNQN